MELIEGLGNIIGFFDGVFPLLESMKHEIVELGTHVRFFCVDLGIELYQSEICSQKSGVTACNVILIVLNWFRIFIDCDLQQYFFAPKIHSDDGEIKLNVPEVLCTLSATCNKEHHREIITLAGFNSRP